MTRLWVEMKLAQQLDPVNPSINVDVCLPYILARQFDQCIVQSRKALEMFPNFYIARMAFGMALFEKGDYATSIEELQKAKAIKPTPHLIGTLGYLTRNQGAKTKRINCSPNSKSYQNDATWRPI